MCSSSVVEAFDSLGALLDTSWDDIGIADRLSLLDAVEKLHRRAAALSHQVIASIAQIEPAALGDVAHKVIADRLRITPAAARRRIRDAGQLQPRLTLIGAPLPPVLAATATAWRDGVLDGEHLRVIQRFCSQAPGHLDENTREHAEAFLAHKAAELRPDQLAKIADRLAAHLNPDGTYTDAERARRRGFTWGPQHTDGMSQARLWATPELRANLDAWFARFAAPGMCDPDDQTPRIHQDAPAEAAARDTRSHAQRQHDALNALVRSQLGNPALGTHHGLPVTVIVSTTLADLQSAAGLASTAGTTLLPMSDVIRMAAHAHHYLTIFDDHSNRPLYLGRTKRIATPDQRIVLHAKDRGCTRPGCDAPGYRCQAHHITAWAAGGRTDIDNLTFACKTDHPLLDQGWTTRKTPDGHTQWIPPPQLQLPTTTTTSTSNDYHHPERYLPNTD